MNNCANKQGAYKISDVSYCASNISFLSTDTLRNYCYYYGPACQFNYTLYFVYGDNVHQSNLEHNFYL